VNPDPRFLCRTTQNEEALTGLIDGIETRKGFTTLTGEVGTGKTTLINSLLDWLFRREPASLSFLTRGGTHITFSTSSLRSLSRCLPGIS
jgi:type II secretory pathway predicted ATPase ExeA